MPNAARLKRGPESVKTTDSAIPAVDCGVRMVCPGKLCALRGVGLGAPLDDHFVPEPGTWPRPIFAARQIAVPQRIGPKLRNCPPAEVLQDAGIDFAPDAGLDPEQNGGMK